MIHYLYVGHFEKDNGAMKLEKRTEDGAPRPILVHPLDMGVIEELLSEKGVDATNVPDNWRLWIQGEGFIVCDAYGHSSDAIDFLRQLATRTGCDVLYDGIVPFSADELTFDLDEPKSAAG